MQKRRIAFSLIAGLLSEIANKLFPILTLQLAARKLGIDAFGVSQFSQWVLDLGIFFVVFGYSNWSMIKWRDSPVEERSKIFGTTTVLRLIHAVLASVAILAFLTHNENWGAYKAIVLQSIFIIFASAVDATWAMTSLNKLSRLSLISLTSKLIGLIAIFFLVQNQSDAPIYTFILMASNATIAVATFLYVLKNIGFQAPSAMEIAKAFKGSIKYAVSFVLMIVLERFDLLLVELNHGANGVGLYSGPSKISQSILPVAGMVSTVFFAEILNIKDKLQFRHHFQTGLRISVLMIAPVLAGSWFVFADLIAIVVGEEFRSSAHLFPILGMAIFPHLLILIFGYQVLTINGQVNKLNLSLTLAVAFIFVFYYGLRQTLTIEHIAWLNTLLRWIAALATIYFASSYLEGKLELLLTVVTALIPSVLMAIVLSFFQDTNFLLLIIIGVATYFVVSCLMFFKEISFLYRRFIAGRTNSSPKSIE